ncbi:MAG TPA: hypothetical protein VK116_03485, partial [Planctomycetota bacterium]|nr:hypothetical protein [Planctomycetota bacterium]
MPARTPALPSPSHEVSVPLSFFLCVLCVLCGELFFSWGEDAGAPELVSRSLRPCLSFFLCVLCGALFFSWGEDAGAPEPVPVT